MKISGLQTLTLLDFPGKVACTVFTSGCNMRCPFCHNAGLVLEPDEPAQMTEDEFFAFLKKRKGVLDGVCMTGGEPLLQTDLIPFFQRVKELGFTTKLDTNGFLTERLRRTVESGAVDYVAMDVKNDPSRYAETVGIPNFSMEPIFESVQYLMSCGVDYEFRTTVVRELHRAGNLTAIAEWLQGAKRYFLQGFRDSGEILGGTMHAYSPQEMRDLLRKVQAILPQTELRGVDV